MFSPDGKYMLTGSADNTAKIWDVATGLGVQTFNGHAEVWGGFFTRWAIILTSSADTTAKLWEVATGKEILTFSGHTNTVYDASFSSDGKYTLTASADRTAKIWDILTGAEVRTLSGHTSAVWSAVFHRMADSSDGKFRPHSQIMGNGLSRLRGSSLLHRLLRDFTEEERTQAHIADQEPTCP